MQACAACGRENDDEGATFCAFCGASLPTGGESGRIVARRPGERVERTRAAPPGGSTVIISLANATIEVDPGGDATAEVRIRNAGSVVDELAVEVHGPAAAWSAAQPSIVRLMPGTEGTSTLRFRPPRKPLVPAGPAAYDVRVVSHESPGQSAEEHGVVHVGVVDDLAAVLVPATAKSRGSTTFAVRLENRGNTPVDATLSASDPDDALALEVVPVALSMTPGATTQALLRVNPRQRFWLGSPEQRQLRVDVSTKRGPSAQAAGTLIQQARLPGWVSTLAMALLVLAVVAAGAYGTGIVGPGQPTAPPTALAPTTAPTLAPTTSATPTPEPRTPNPSPLTYQQQIAGTWWFEEWTNGTSQLMLYVEITKGSLELAEDGKATWSMSIRELGQAPYPVPELSCVGEMPAGSDFLNGNPGDAERDWTPGLLPLLKDIQVALCGWSPETGTVLFDVTHNGNADQPATRLELRNDQGTLVWVR